jgi:hypothetical protein
VNALLAGKLALDEIDIRYLQEIAIVNPVVSYPLAALTIIEHLAGLVPF